MSPGTPRRPDPGVIRFVEACASAQPADAAGTIAAVVARVASARGVTAELIVDGRRVVPSVAVEAIDDVGVAAGEWGPWLPGFVRELLMAPAARRRLGVHHTPPGVVDEILDLVEYVSGPIAAAGDIVDPAAGGGAFLLGALRRMGGRRPDAAGRVWAVDVDPLALATTRAAIALWSGVDGPDDRFIAGDFLDPAVALRLPTASLVLGNPPFLSQLRSGTSRTPAALAAMRERWPDVGGYVDEAAAFLLAASELLAEHGTLALVQPDSVLSAAAAAPVRARLQTTAPIRGLWVDRDRSFAASVDTVAVVNVRGVQPGPVRVDGGDLPAPRGDAWSPLLAAARGVPALRYPTGRPTLGSIAHVTAGFRDEYYGLVDAVVDDPDGAHPLMTVGSIDPLRDRWGVRPTRFAKQRFDHPTVRVDRVAPAIGDWVAARLVPKVLVASQTKVLEAIADPSGQMVPSVPVVSVEPEAAAPSLWHVVAVVTCPVATVLALHAAAGSALSAGAIRVSASGLAALPLPADGDAWDRAAQAARDGDVEACGKAMLVAHGCGDRSDIFEFWRSRLPS